MRPFSRSVAKRRNVRVPLSYLLKRMGMTTGLKICLDAGDKASYPGSGTQWLDTSGNGHHFDFGATTAAPTFVGTAGRLSSGEYLSFDGGDHLTIAGGNPSWVQNLHKDNAIYSILLLMQGVAPSAIQRICGTDGGNNANIGFSCLFNATNNMGLQMRFAGGAGMNQVSTLTVDGTAAFYGFSLNESVGASGIQYRKDGSTNTDTSTYSTPSGSNATYALQIGAGGNNANPFANGTRLFGFAMWEGVALTQAQMATINAATRARLS
jgi:hypothetical protein